MKALIQSSNSTTATPARTYYTLFYRHYPPNSIIMSPQSGNDEESKPWTVKSVATAVGLGALALTGIWYMTRGGTTKLDTSATASVPIPSSVRTATASSGWKIPFLGRSSTAGDSLNQAGAHVRHIGDDVYQIRTDAQNAVGDVGSAASEGSRWLWRSAAQKAEDEANLAASIAKSAAHTANSAKKRA